MYVDRNSLTRICVTMFEVSTDRHLMDRRFEIIFVQGSPPWNRSFSRNINISGSKNFLAGDPGFEFPFISTFRGLYLEYDTLIEF